MNPYYTDYAEYLSRLFPGQKVQKLSINAGMTCPNRDGTVGTGGCIYCDNRTFSPPYTDARLSIRRQIEDGRKFFGRKYPLMKYLAYFQSYTNTFAPAGTLRRLYGEALDCEGIVGIIIGTRPDCLPPATLDLLEETARRVPVIVEIGAETSHDHTLREINRHHTWQCVCEAIGSLHDRGIHVGLHLIAGLPGETREDILATVRAASALPIDTLKLHQMQVIRGTELHRRYLAGTDRTLRFTVDQYLDLCADLVATVPRRIAIERFVSQSPADMLVSPRLGLKNYQFTDRLHRKLRDRITQKK